MKNNLFTVLVLAFLLLQGLVLQAQSSAVDKDAEFPGGQNALLQFLSKNISYPSVARNAKAEGTVVIKFMIEADGTPTNFEAANGGPKTHPELFQEAIRVLKLMPKWIPAQKDGKATRSEMMVPVKFKLQ
jgi:TonB family protein